MKQDFTSQTGREWEAIRDLATSINAAAYSETDMGVNLSAEGQVVNVREQRVSAGFFHVLGVDPMKGRGFTREEDREDGPAVTVISCGLWESLFDADPSVLGRRVLLEGMTHTVVGVMPRDFRTSVPARRHSRGCGSPPRCPPRQVSFRYNGV